MQHTSSPAVEVRSDHGVVFVAEIVLHVDAVYLNTVAADFSCAVRSVHVFDTDAGCASRPDALSQDTCVYPSTTAACCWLSCVDVTERAARRKWSSASSWANQWKDRTCISLSARCRYNRFNATHPPWQVPANQNKRNVKRFLTCRQRQIRPWCLLRHRDRPPRLLRVSQHRGR